MTETPTMSMTPQQAQEKARKAIMKWAGYASFTDRAFANEVEKRVAAALLSVHNEAVERCAEVAEAMAPDEVVSAEDEARCRTALSAAYVIRTLKVEEQT